MAYLQSYKPVYPMAVQPHIGSTQPKDTEPTIVLSLKGGRFSMLDGTNRPQDLPSNFDSQDLERIVLQARYGNISPADHTPESRTRPQNTASNIAPVLGQPFNYAPQQQQQQSRFVQYSTDPRSAINDAMQPISTSDSATKIEDESEGEKTAKRMVTRHFRIDDTEKVEEFLISRLSKMQQTAVKRLAKAWIKGICPKKQAKFPYHSAAVVPGWWPKLNDCPFREPDHIKKEKRLNLCLHLLRLRPQEGELQLWNADPDMHHEDHDFSRWTKFLQTWTSTEVLKDPKESLESIERRTAYLNELYKVAQMEEDYLNGAIDGEDTFTWVEDPSDRMAELRRRRAENNATPQALKRMRPQSKPQSPTSDLGLEHSPASYYGHKAESGDERPRKRNNTGQIYQSITTNSSMIRDDAVSSNAPHLPIDYGAMPVYQANTAVVPAPAFAEYLRRRYGSTSMNNTQEDMLTTSFSSTTSYGAPSITDSFMANNQNASTVSMRMHNYTSNTQSMAVPAHMVTHIPQPHFETVPNSPVVPHPTLLGLTIDHNAALAASTQPHPWAMEGITPSQPCHYPISSFSSTMNMPSNSLASTPMTRAGSDSFAYTDLRQPSGQNLTNASSMRSDGCFSQQALERAPPGYDTYTRPT